MCIVIDINALPKVFNKNEADFCEFLPVQNWVLNGCGKVVYGGSKYQKEIPYKYVRLFLELKKQGKLVRLDKKTVDEAEEAVKKLYVHKDFDDPHLVAIFRVSKCQLFCSVDKRSFRFIKNTVKGVDFYPKRMKSPRIYSNKKHGEALLCNSNIARICKG